MKNLYDYEDTQSATVDLPFGAFKNESAPGKQDGTAIVAEHIQDIVYPLYQILQLAGITPDGELEDGNSKTQFIQALTNIGIFRYSDKSIYNKSVFVWNVIGSVFTLYRSAKDNNNADINDETSWIKILELGSDNKINFYVDTNIYGDYLNKDLSNLSSVGIDKINQSKALETGSVSSDADVYADIQKYAHSTFDLSKFEVVGSPVITEDGIASNFTNSNYAETIPVSKISLNTFMITCDFKWIEKQGTIFSSVRGGSNEYGIALIINANKLGFFSSSNGTGWNVADLKTGSTSLVSKNIYKVSVIFTGTQYICMLLNKNTGALTTEFTVDSTDKVFAGLNMINFGSSNSYWQPLNGSIDLKSIAIWAGGVPVFSGNKTGLDVIKPDDYEVVGEPTITDDGVVSNLSLNNCVKITNLDFSKGKVIYDIAGTLNNVNESGNSYLSYFENDTEKFFLLQVKNNTGLQFATNINGQATYGSVLVPSDLYGKFSLHLEMEENSSTYKLINNGTTSTGTLAIGYSSFTKPFTSCTVGDSTLLNFSGSIDLNSIKVYSNGNLIYQPCLKIPYTESKTGSKIVDVAYRDRVQDLYEQTGEALFYTIDEENQNFTLPMGEIYGMISKNEEILDVIYPIGRPMQEINNELLDNEIWLEGATVSRTDYANLFNVYGTTYGEGDGSTTFQLPDLRDRVLWGSPDGSNGYIEAALPNIKGKTGYGGPSGETNSGRINGAFYNSGSYSGWTFGGNNSRDSGVSFSASRSSSIYSDNATTVQPPAFKVRWKTRFK